MALMDKGKSNDTDWSFVAVLLGMLLIMASAAYAFFCALYWLKHGHWPQITPASVITGLGVKLIPSGFLGLDKIVSYLMNCGMGNVLLGYGLVVFYAGAAWDDWKK